MPRPKLTQRVIAKLPVPHPDAKQTIYWDEVLRGFGVQCSGKTNQKLYIAQRDVVGRTRRVTLGTVSGLALDEAKKRAEDDLRRWHRSEAEVENLPEAEIRFPAANAQVAVAIGIRALVLQSAPTDALIKNSASELALGVDVRGEGGMAIAPPSTHPRGGEYVWLNDLDIAQAPEWLIALARKSDVCRHAGAARQRRKKKRAEHLPTSMH